MKKTVKHYQTILEHLISGISLHQIIRDEKNNFIDFIFLDVNKAFEEITGLKRENIIGKKASEILPYIRKRKFDWFQLYNEIDVNNSRKNFEYYSVSVNKWYKVNVFSLEKNYFVTEFHDITELKRAEDKIKERELNFREFFESPGILRAICKVIGDEIVFFMVNKELARFFNRSHEEFEGKSFKDLGIPDYIKEIWLENFRKSKETGEPVTFEYLNSANRWRFAISHYIGTDEEGYSKFSLALQDITDRKINEQELKLSEEKFSKAFSSSPYAICFTKFKDGTIIDVNEGFLKITGYQYDELVGKTTVERKLWVNLQDREELLNELVSKGKVLQKEYKFRIKSGKIITGLTSAELIYINNEKCILTSVLDITERKISEIALKQSEERFRKIFEEAPIAMVIFDKNYNIIRVNNAFCYLVGCKDDRMFKSLYKNFIHNEYFVQDEENYAKLLNGEIPAYKAVKKFLRSNGDVFWGSATTSALYDSEGNITYLIEMVEDVTDKKLTEQNLILAKERAEELNRIKSNFLAQMSHELRTPMVGIIGFSDLLKENLKEKRLCEFAEKISKSSKRLLDTLNQLLDISIIEARKLKIKFSTFNIVKEIEDVINFFQSSASEKNIELKFQSEFDNLNVYSDVAIVRQILNNLINNSIKYTNEGYINVSLNLETKNDKRYLCITVEDTGIGIPKEKQEIIWDAFRQVSEGHGRTFEGVGLGLTITKNLVNALDGLVYLKESLVGKGSKFVVLLPYFEKSIYRTDYINDDYKEEKKDLKVQLPLIEALYVEDDREAIYIVESFLKDICKVDFAMNAVDGINQAKIKKYDLILMDINFRTGMDGLQAVEEIRKIPWYENVPIVAVTAFAMEKDKKEFLERGCTHYIAKPFGRDEFVAFIKQIIENIKLPKYSLSNNKSQIVKN